MSKIYTVAVVGAGIGRSHITEGYLNNPDKFKRDRHLRPRRGQADRPR